VAELLRSGLEVISGLVLETKRDRVAPGWPDGPPLYVVTPAVLDGVAGFPVHRGVLALARRPPTLTVEALVDARTLVVLEDLNDHENLGAIGRSARALGGDALLLSPRCADPYYRRSIRVSQGHLLRVPIARATRWPEDLAGVAAAGRRVIALTADDGVPIDALSVGHDEPIALVVGAEGPGLTAGARATAQLAVTIPMTTGVDSLNVGHATAIALHAVAVARRSSRNRHEPGGGASHPAPTIPA
jgi:tRNA G18 (ribose-2'-O)-methylase SpoU